MKFSVVSKLVIKCGEKLQCLRNPDFVRFSQKKYPESPADIKKPRSSGKNPFLGPCSVKPMANRELKSISQEVIELEI